MRLEYPIPGQRKAQRKTTSHMLTRVSLLASFFKRKPPGGVLHVEAYFKTLGVFCLKRLTQSSELLTFATGGAKDPVAKDATPSKPQPKAEAVSMDMEARHRREVGFLHLACASRVTSLEAQPKASPKAGRPGRLVRVVRNGQSVLVVYSSWFDCPRFSRRK